MSPTTTGIMDAIVKAGSQTALATALGVTQQAVQQWALRGYVPVSRVVEIEALYGIERHRLINPKYLEQSANFTAV